MSTTKPLRIAVAVLAAAALPALAARAVACEHGASGVVRPALSATSPAQPRTSSYGARSATRVTSITVEYRAHNGCGRHAVVLLPVLVHAARQPAAAARHLAARPRRHGQLQRDVLGHATRRRRLRRRQPRRHGPARSTASRTATAARSTTSPGCRRSSTQALPWVHIDRGRIYALGSSMGGQETLLLVARHPHLLAGAAALDSVTDMTAATASCCRERRSARWLQDEDRSELGGTPAGEPRAYAARSPLSQARALAASGVPLQIWWSTQDRIVIDQAHQSGTLFRTLRRAARGPASRRRRLVARTRRRCAPPRCCRWR